MKKKNKFCVGLQTHKLTLKGKCEDGEEKPYEFLDGKEGVVKRRFSSLGRAFVA